MQTTPMVIKMAPPPNDPAPENPPAPDDQDPEDPEAAGKDGTPDPQKDADPTQALLADIAKDLKSQVNIDLSDYSLLDQVKIMRKMIAANSGGSDKKTDGKKDPPGSETDGKKAKPKPPKAANPAESDTDGDKEEKFMTLAEKNSKGTPWMELLNTRKTVGGDIMERFIGEKKK